MMIPADSPPPSCFGPAAGDAPAGRDRGGRVRRPPSAHDGSTGRGQDDAGPGVGSPDEAGRGHPPHGADGRTDRQAPWTFWSDFRSACPTVLGTRLGSATQPHWPSILPVMRCDICRWCLLRARVMRYSSEAGSLRIWIQPSGHHHDSDNRGLELGHERLGRTHGAAHRCRYSGH